MPEAMLRHSPDALLPGASTPGFDCRASGVVHTGSSNYLRFIDSRAELANTFKVLVADNVTNRAELSPVVSLFNESIEIAHEFAVRVNRYNSLKLLTFGNSYDTAGLVTCRAAHCDRSGGLL